MPLVCRKFMGPWLKSCRLFQIISENSLSVGHAMATSPASPQRMSYSLFQKYSTAVPTLVHRATHVQIQMLKLIASGKATAVTHTLQSHPSPKALSKRVLLLIVNQALPLWLLVYRNLTNNRTHSAFIEVAFLTSLGSRPSLLDQHAVMKA